MEYVITNYLATVPAAVTIATFTVQTPGVDRKHMISEFPHISTVGLKDSCIMQVRIFRNATNASDTYNQPAFATDFDIHYQSRPVDFGSVSEYGNN